MEILWKYKKNPTIPVLRPDLKTVKECWMSLFGRISVA